MRTAKDWATIRQGVLGAVPAAGSLEDRARSGTIEEFVRIVQEDALPPIVEPTPMEQVLGAVQSELQVAMADFGPMHSAHEGYAVIAEEMDELKAEVWKNQSRRDYRRMEKEAIQVAAMAVRLILDVVQSPTKGQEALKTPCNNCGFKFVKTSENDVNCPDCRPTDTRPSAPNAPYPGDGGVFELKAYPEAPTPAVAQMNAANKAMDEIAQRTDDRLHEIMTESIRRSSTLDTILKLAHTNRDQRMIDLVNHQISRFVTQFDEALKGLRSDALKPGTTTYRERPTQFVHGNACSYRQNTGDCDCGGIR